MIIAMIERPILTRWDVRKASFPLDAEKIAIALIELAKRTATNKGKST